MDVHLVNFFFSACSCKVAVMRWVKICVFTTVLSEGAWRFAFTAGTAGVAASAGDATPTSVMLATLSER